MQRTTEDGYVPQMRVLVADDDPIARSLIRSQMLQRFKAEVVEAADGLEAWNLLLSETHQLAVVDLSMPNLDGFSLIQCMRGHPRTRHMPIIVVTSRDDRETIQKALEVGATSFLTKPVSWSTFGHYIEFLLRSSSAAHAARSAAQQINATTRAKDAIASRVYTEVLAVADAITQEAETLGRQHAETGAEDLSGPLINIQRYCGDLRGRVAYAVSFSRVLSENVEVRERRWPLADLLARAEEQVQDVARSLGVTVVRHREPAVAVTCDAEAVSLAIAQLTENAILHSPASEAVFIDADMLPDGMLAVSITDRGPGMDPAFVAHCLGTVSLGATRSAPASDGLSLPLAKAIIEAHSGQLEIRSMPGQGTTASLIMPADRVMRNDRAAA